MSPSGSAVRLATCLTALALAACGLPAPFFRDPAPAFVERAPGVYEGTRTGGVTALRPEEVKIRLMEEAGVFCQRQGKGMSVLDTSMREATPGDYATATVQFTCR